MGEREGGEREMGGGVEREKEREGVRKSESVGGGGGEGREREMGREESGWGREGGVCEGWGGGREGGGEKGGEKRTSG